MVNNSGKVIWRVYCSSTDSWEEDILGNSTLENGSSVKITFPPSQDARYWDLKVVFRDDSSWYWTGLDLFNISRITVERSGKIRYS